MLLFFFYVQSIDTVVHFLQKAARNLKTSFSVVVPDKHMLLGERRKLLGKQLAEFVMLYRKVKSMQRSYNNEHAHYTYYSCVVSVLFLTVIYILDMTCIAII